MTTPEGRINFVTSWLSRGGGSGPQDTKIGTKLHQSNKKNDDSSDRLSSSFCNMTVAAAPSIIGFGLKTFFGITFTLYVLNQKHMLPMPLGRVVSKALFWPTLPITVSRRIGSWSNTVVDDTVVMGGAPFGFCNIPEKLYREYGVSIPYQVDTWIVPDFV